MYLSLSLENFLFKYFEVYPSVMTVEVSSVQGSTNTEEGHRTPHVRLYGSVNLFINNSTVAECVSVITFCTLTLTLEETNEVKRHNKVPSRPTPRSMRGRYASRLG